jgi:hypothetical protein
MPLILAIESDRRQVAQLTALARNPLGAEIICADTAEQGLKALGSRVPDVILTSAFLSPKDESLLADRLRELDASAAHVQTIAIPVLASPGRRQGGGGMLGRLRRGSKHVGTLEGCDPKLFAEQIAAYLERSAAERAAIHGADEHEDDSRPAAGMSLTEAAGTRAKAAGFSTPAAKGVVEHENAPASAAEPPVARAGVEPTGQSPLEPVIEQVFQAAIDGLADAAVEPAIDDAIEPTLQEDLSRPIEIEPLLASPAEQIGPIAGPHAEPVEPAIEPSPAHALERAPESFESTSEPLFLPEVEAAVDAPPEGVTEPSIDTIGTHRAHRTPEFEASHAATPEPQSVPAPAPAWSEIDLNGSTEDEAEGAETAPDPDTAMPTPVVPIARSAATALPPTPRPELLMTPRPPLSVTPRPPRRAMPPRNRVPVADTAKVRQTEDQLKRWQEALEDLKREVDRMRVQRERPVAARKAVSVAAARRPTPPPPPEPPPKKAAEASQRSESPAGPQADATPARKRRKPTEGAPVQDEWGLFDPEQCGFAALLAKLEEMEEEDEAPPKSARQRKRA